MSIETIIKRLSDDELRNQIRLGQLKLKKLQDEIALSQQFIADSQAELDQRLKEASPIKAGDEVLVSYEITSKYTDDTSYTPYVDRIEGLLIEDGEVRPFIYHTDFSITDALSMRAAYLAQQEAKQP